MPLYEYQCEACSTCFTRQLKIAEMHLPESEPCVKCGEVQVKKKILTGILFNADVVKPTSQYKELVRTWKKNIPHNTLPDY